MSDSFQINDDLLDTDSTNLLDDALQDAIQKLEARRLRLLAHAYHAGYDGVDIIPAQDVYTRVEDYRLSFKYEAWEGDPPVRDRFSPVTRYDFRHLDECGVRELLAHIGVTPNE